MARYIDADKVMGEIARIGGHNLCGWDTIGVKALIDRQPTADVAPKSDVEALQEAISKAEADVKNYMKVAEYQQSLSIKRYHEIKRLKEDIERLEDINERDVENIRLAKAEVAREIFEKIYEDCFDQYGYINYDALAELKKKYTEGKT